MKYIKDYKYFKFIKESEKIDKELLIELNYLIDLGEDITIDESYEFTVGNILQTLNESIAIFEDDADELDKDIEYRNANYIGDKSLWAKVKSAAAWVVFPFSKIIQKIIASKAKIVQIERTLKDIPPGPKRDKLEAKLQKLNLDQIAAVQDLKTARKARDEGKRIGFWDRQRMKQNKRDKDKTMFDHKIYNGPIISEEGKMSSEELKKQKEKIKDQGEKEGEKQGKKQAKELGKKAEEVVKKLSGKSQKEKAAVADKLDDTIEKKKAEYEKAMDKAKKAGINL